MDERPNLAQLWPPTGPCGLCETVGPLCRSHIIPKFVGDWLRRTGVTGRLRSSKTPDKLVQDLVWRYLLCSECEERFSQFETEVCERIFLPLHNRQEDRFRYGRAFTLFAVSVVWRALILLRREGRLEAFDEAPGSVDAAEAKWRAFLLGKSRTPAPHVIHAVPMDIPIDLNASGLSPYWGRFVLRTPAIGGRFKGGSGYIIVKMGRLFVIGTVVPGPERQEWKRTQLHAEGGAWGVDKWHIPGWFYWHLDKGARDLQRVEDGLSDHQKRVSEQKVWEIVKRDPDLVGASDAFRAFEADLGLFGDIVFRPSDEKPPSEE